MTLLFATLISILTGGFRLLSEKYGKKVTKNATVVCVFVLSAIIAWLRIGGYITSEVIESLIQLGTMAIGIYEVLYKRILEPIFQKIIG